MIDIYNLNYDLLREFHLKKIDEILHQTAANFGELRKGESNAEFAKKVIKIIAYSEQTSEYRRYDGLAEILYADVPRDEVLKWRGSNGWSQWDVNSFVGKNPKALMDVITAQLPALFAARGFDYGKTARYTKWRYTDTASMMGIAAKPELEVGAEVFLTRNSTVFKVKSIKADREGYYKVVLKGRDKLEYEGRHDLPELIILKAKGN